MSNKKIFSLLFLVVLILIQDGCGGGSGGSGQTSQTQTPPVTTGSAVLSWSAVTTYSDNTNLILGGYKVYYGTAPGKYTQKIDVPVAYLSNPNAPSYTITSLLQGTYYFAVCAYDTSNAEGILSAEGSKTIL